MTRQAMIAAAFGLLMTTQSQGTFADVPGARLWYVDTGPSTSLRAGGGSAPIVLLHAATGSSAVWEHQVPAFTKAGYRVIAYDRRGFGRTTLDSAGPQPGTGADDLRALLDHLRIERCHLVATAAGGFVAWEFALSFPDRLRSLVVANSIGSVQDEEYLALGQRLRAPDFANMPADFRELGPSYRAANPDGTKRWNELERTNRPEGARPVTQDSKVRVTFALLETIKVPTLLMTGDADLYAPPAVMKMFSARVKGAESIAVPDAGHSVYWEQPDVFNRSVLAFIGKH